MLKVPIIYVKDKQAFEKKDGMLRLLGSAVEVARDLRKKYKLLHIVDLDLKKGNTANSDIYDKLTYFINIEVECDEAAAAERLLKINARVVLQLPTKLPVEKWNRRLLVGIVRDDENAGEVHDVILATPTKKKIEKYEKEGKRVMLYENEWDKKTKVWAVILPGP